MIPLTPVKCEVGVLSLVMDHSRVIAGCEDNHLRVWDYSPTPEHNTFNTDAWSTLTYMMEERNSRLRQQQAAGLGSSQARQNDAR